MFLNTIDSFISIINTDWVPGYPIKPTIYILHLFEAGYYILGLYTTFFLELYVKKKKDFLIQLFHHFVALLLIILSIGARQVY